MDSRSDQCRYIGQLLGDRPIAHTTTDNPANISDIVTIAGRACSALISCAGLAESSASVSANSGASLGNRRINRHLLQAKAISIIADAKSAYHFSEDASRRLFVGRLADGMTTIYVNDRLKSTRRTERPITANGIPRIDWRSL
jgi:hypothetical protein